MSTKNSLVSRALECFRVAYEPFVQRRLISCYQHQWETRAREVVRAKSQSSNVLLDVANIITLITRLWDPCDFRSHLSLKQRAYLYEIRDVRNRWAHQEPMSSQDMYRFLDSVERLCGAVDAPRQVAEVKVLRHFVLVKMAETTRDFYVKKHEKIPGTDPRRLSLQDLILSSLRHTHSTSGAGQPPPSTGGFANSGGTGGFANSSLGMGPISGGPGWGSMGMGLGMGPGPGPGGPAVGPGPTPFQGVVFEHGPVQQQHGFGAFGGPPGPRAGIGPMQGPGGYSNGMGMNMGGFGGGFGTTDDHDDVDMRDEYQ